MTALAAPETGVQTETAPALNPRDFADPNAYLDAKYPATVGCDGPPVILGQAGRAAFDASIQQAASDVEAIRQASLRAARHDRERVDGWLAEARERTAQMRAAVAIPAAHEDSAGPADREAAGPAETSSEGAS